MTISSFVSRNRVALHNYVERDKLRPIVVTSPHPPEECLRRLAKVTTDRKSGWYLDWRTATLPDPLFHGVVGPRGIRVGLFAEVGRRGGVRAWFDAQAVPAPGGGTTLTGTIGSTSAQANATAAVAYVGFWAVAGVVSFVVRMAIVVPVIAALALIVSGAYDIGPRLEAAEGPSPGLSRKINDVLESTSASPG